MYKYHILELRDEQLNVKKDNATSAVGKREPKKTSGSYGIRTHQLSVGLLAQLVRALHRYRRVQGFDPVKA